jgi:hypothetical protein
MDVARRQRGASERARRPGRLDGSGLRAASVNLRRTTGTRSTLITVPQGRPLGVLTRRIDAAADGEGVSVGLARTTPNKFAVCDATLLPKGPRSTARRLQRPR